jgi:hypothetical protein
LPLVHSRVEGCSYAQGQHIAAFNARNLPVVLEANKITIYDVENEEEARRLMEWLSNILETSK